VRGLRGGSLLTTLSPQQHLQPGQTFLVGIVTDNKDPQGWGRVKVKFPTLTEEHTSHWARIVAIGAADNRGFDCLPEINDEVLVGFEHGDIHRPYIIGGVWNGKDAPPAAVSDSIQQVKVRLRTFKTRTGHILQFVEEDKGGSKVGAYIETAGGHKFSLNDSDAYIEVETPRGHQIKMSDFVIGHLLFLPCPLVPFTPNPHSVGKSEFPRVPRVPRVPLSLTPNPSNMGKPAARIGDAVAHPTPPVLTGGPGSPNVLIGSQPAWRGIPQVAVAALQAAKQMSDTTIKTAEAATLAAAGTPGAPAAKAAEETTKATAATTTSSAIAAGAGSADIHNCNTPLPTPPHGPGVVIDGSTTVLINNLPACRQGDTILEALGPLNKITGGEMTVLIGG
jgi:uncharacterized Zn-binding protein involved in type VI secretion